MLYKARFNDNHVWERSLVLTQQTIEAQMRPVYFS